MAAATISTNIAEYDLARWAPESDDAVHDLYGVHTSANIGEDLPQIVTPFTTDAAALIGRGFFATMKTARNLGALGLTWEEHAIFVRVFYGRAHLNISLIRAHADTLPGTDAAAIDEQYLGWKRDPANPPPPKTTDQVLTSLAVLPRILRNFKYLAGLVASNEARIRAHLPAAMAEDLSDLSAGELLARLERNLDWTGYTLELHIHNALAISSGMESSGAMLRAGLGDAVHDGLLPSLTTGLGTVESAKPSFEIWRLSRIVEAEADLRALYQSTPVTEIEAALEADRRPVVQAFQGAFRAFLDQYGYRALNEMEYSAARWSEDPHFVHGMIRNYTGEHRADHEDPAQTQMRQAAVREKTMAWVEQRLPLSVRLEFRNILGLAHVYGPAREQTKSQWIRLIWPCRRYLLALGARLVEAGVYEQPDDVFFCRLPELRDAVAGAAPSDLSTRIANRRVEYRLFHELELPEYFEGRPTPRLKGSGERQEAVAVLSGIPVSPGRVTGVARVIRDPSEDAEIREGEILVAPVTDAAWTPLFFTAAAVVVDLGGPLSHGSTVAREYGIPAVVNVKTGTQQIRDGQTITVDGTTGEVILTAD